VAGVSSSVQRTSSIVLSLGAVGLSAVLAFRSTPSFGSSAASSSASGSALDAGTGAHDGDAGATALDLALTVPDASPLALPEPIPPVDVPEGGFHLADGTPVAPLGKGAPRHVRFGVVLVTYEGAEGAPDKGARSKSDALSLATKLAEEAKGDFRGAVQRGDSSGSSDDVGDVTRGVLEPTPEAVLFALPVGGVSAVVDTPRGFWIVKRLE
jgi:hypothetical protein